MDELNININEKSVKEFCNLDKLKNAIKSSKNEILKKTLEEYLGRCSKDEMEHLFTSTFAIDCYKKMPKKGQIEDLLLGALGIALSKGFDNITPEIFQLEILENSNNARLLKYVATLKTFYPAPAMWEGTHKYWTKLALEDWN